MKILLKLREWYKQEKIGLFLKEFDYNEYTSIDELRNLQKTKLLNLLHYLNQYNTFYKNYFSSNEIDLKGSINDDLDSLLGKLPVTDKSFLKSKSRDWVSTNDEIELTQATTSGSTGFPFKIYHSKTSRDIKAANKFRLFKWNKINRWERQVYFGCTYGPPKTLSSRIKIFLNDKLIWNKHIIDFTDISEAKIQFAISELNRLKPVSIWGYPSVIFEIAYFIIKNNISIDNENLKAVILSGESHTKHMSMIIQKAFKIPIIDEYNANEGFIAGTCEYGNLHLMEDTLIAEVLHEDGTISETGYGELLISFLHSTDYPFLRYKIGDIVEISDEKCTCGRVFKTITSLDGRKGSTVINGDNKISNSTCNHYVTKSSFIDVIKNYQIVQNDYSSIIIKIVKTDHTRDFSDFENLMKTLFDKLEVSFEYLDEIPKQKSGKHIDVINNINQKQV